MRSVSSGASNRSAWVKDAFHRRVVNGERGAVNPSGVGTKAAAWYSFTVAPGEQQVIRCRLSPETDMPDRPFDEAFDARVDLRRSEAEQFNLSHRNMDLTAPEERLVVRQAGRRHCCGRGSSMATSSNTGYRAIRESPRRPKSGLLDATTSGGTFTRETSSRCRTSGSIPGSRIGI